MEHPIKTKAAATAQAITEESALAAPECTFPKVLEHIIGSQKIVQTEWMGRGTLPGGGQELAHNLPTGHMVAGRGPNRWRMLQ